MKTSFDFYEVAQVVGSKKYVTELFGSTPEVDHDRWLIVKKSARIWAAFSGEGANVIPSHETTYTVAEFMEL